MLCINFRKINSDLLRYKEVVCNEDNIIIITTIINVVYSITVLHCGSDSLPLKTNNVIEL